MKCKWRPSLVCCRWLILFILLIFLFSEVWANEPVDVQFKSDGSTLKGKFFAGQGEGPFPTFLLNHGFPGSELDVLGLGEALSNFGINVLTFNVRGTHQSEGLFSLENTQKDLESALAFILQQETVRKFQIDTAGIILGGWSFGGGMSLTYAAHHPEIRRIVSIAGTDHGEFAREYMRNPSLKEMFDSMFKEIEAPKGPVRYKSGGAIKELIDHINYYHLRKSAPALADRDILLIGGWDDINVTIEQNLLPLYRALRKEKAERIKFIVYQTDHSFRNIRKQLAADIEQWIKHKF